MTVRFALNLQSTSNLTMSPNMSKYKFVMKTLILRYSEGGKMKEPDYHVIRSQAIPFKNLIKSTKTGKVSLTSNWKDCGAWIGLQSV